MARGNACIFYPQVNGEDSKLYKDLLLKKGLKRPFVNYLYARYTASNGAMATAMDQVMDSQGNPKYRRGSQGQHTIDDFLDFIQYADMQRELMDIVTAEVDAGATDATGHRIDYTDAKVALEKAKRFNSSHNALVAYVNDAGNIYHIYVVEKTAENHTIPIGIEERLQLWDILKQSFSNIGVDVDNLSPEVKKLVNPFRAVDLIVNLQNLIATSTNHISEQDMVVLLSLNPNAPIVQRAIAHFGSAEACAKALYDNIHNNVMLSNHDRDLLVRAIDQSKMMQGLDINALRQQLSSLSQQIVTNSQETTIKQEIEHLNQLYHINMNEIYRKGKKINKLSEAAADAVFVLQRQIREIEDKRGTSAEGRRLENILHQLMLELANRKYYSGMMNFLNEAQAQVFNMDNMLLNTPQNGTGLENAIAMTKTLQAMKKLMDSYEPIISALANEHVQIDEKLNQTDIDRIRQSARDIKQFLNDKADFIEHKTESVMCDILVHIIGNEAPDGQSIINVVQMAAVDSSMMDFLYSVGRASNPIIAAMGSIIREAQNGRDAMMRPIGLRIRRANHRLKKAGHNSEFMYEDQSHIISDIDWAAYKEARDNEIRRLYSLGLDKYDIKQGIEDWEDLNTEDRVVDVRNGVIKRTERVPNSSYRKNNGLVWDNSTHRMIFTDASGYTKAQEDYYNDMMQLKGEIGSLLPAYAQHQYLPPQVRRGMLDAIGKAKSAKDVFKAILNKIKNFWTVREDDTNYAMNGIIDADEFKITRSDSSNTKLRQIPIFNINPIEQGELLLNFSTGLQALAGSAINYYTMNSIVDTVEFMGDFVVDQTARKKQLEADMVQDKEIRIIKALFKKGRNTNNEALIEGFISKHIYGEHIDPEENKYLSKMWSNIIGYTSFKSLSTNIKGAFSNYLVGEFQMMIEAGAGEYYGFKSFLKAHAKLFGNAGVPGEIMDLWTNNMNSKATLFREMFDPINENFSDQSHKKYHTNIFRQLVGHDCSFLGYASGEFLIHYVNMYAILMEMKVKHNGRLISLYDAFEVVNKQDGNSELQLKQGVTDEAGNTITERWLMNVRERIRSANQNTHGSMNDEDKGLLHRYWWGRGIMNFRQWMVEHYSRRFRKRHFDESYREYKDGKWIEGAYREGYWTSFINAVWNESAQENWKNKNYGGVAKDVMTSLMVDWIKFTFRAQSQWSNLSEMEKRNIKRVNSELTMFVALLGLSFVLGEPDRHKKEWWRRWWIYQTKRLILDTEASLPNPKMITSGLTILQSPMAGVDTLNSLLYAYYGLFNGDVTTEIKSGPHKGENKYWRNIKKNVLPFIKDWEQMQRLDTDDGIFKVFESKPNRF